jgi:hypothetical protein
VIGRACALILLAWLAVAVLAEISGCAARLDPHRLRFAAEQGGGTVEVATPF